MNALDQLNSYLRSIEKRLRFFAVSRGAAIVTAVALLVTLILVFITNRYAFSERSLIAARFVLFIALGVAIGYGLVIPLLRLGRRNAARRAEARFPEFKERLLTVTECQDTGNPFVQLVADDAMDVARASGPERLVSSRSIFGFLSTAVIALLILGWLFSGPGYLGYGTSVLWAGVPKDGAHALYDIVVTPGNRTVRRKSDQLITAQIMGFQPSKVSLYARYGAASKWEQVAMEPQPHGSAYEFLFASLSDDVEYYVEAGAVTSKHFTLRVVDLPGVKKIRVTYHYPSWTGMQDAVEDPGGDLRAVEGTQADVAVETDRPLAHGVLMLSDDSQIAMKPADGNWLTARVPIDKDGMYHIAALEHGENVRLSEDYFIEAKKDLAPVVKMIRPGRDAKVNPVEEVSVEVQGSDDFGLHELSLHYSVNGGPEKTVSMLPHAGAKEASGKTTLYLEDYKMSPGDLITLYATARDARNTAKTDMYFIQAEPFEKNYSQSQQEGGGQGAGEDQSQISERQKEIIAATWNEIKNGAKDPATAHDDAKFLSELEGTLSQQAKSLADRMRARQLAGASQQFQTFASEMDQASQHMKAAVEKLKTMKWNESLGPEQQALQSLLRAEAVFRDIQVAFGNKGQGQGGGASRDLENMFDLELDTEKNQYETGQQAASASQKEKEVDEALQKLKELAKRQQELAQQQQKQQQAFKQRWEQEMLRREAEELQRKMEQLQRGESAQQQQQSNSQGQQGGQQSSSQQSSSSQQQAGKSSPSSARQRIGQTADPRLDQALERLKQATEDMRRAENTNGNAEQGNAGQRRAADRLQEASTLLNGMRRDQAAGQLDEMNRQAGRLAEQQKDYQNRLKNTFGNSPDGRPQPGQGQQQMNAMAAEKEQLARDLKKLEDQMQSASRNMAGTQPSTSSKLRDALAGAQQNELDLRMRKAAELLRRGQGMYTWPGEPTVTAGLEELRDQVRQAQAALRPDDQQKGNQPGGAGNDQLARALEQLERTRQRMQDMADGQQPGNRPGQKQNGQQRGSQQQGQQQGQGQQGQQPGQQRGQGQQGQQPGQQQGQGQGQQGQQPGQQQGQGQQGQQPGQQPGQGQQGGDQQGNQPGGQYGVGSYPGSPHNGWMSPDQMAREAIRDLSALRPQLRDNPELAGQVQDVLQQLQRATTAYQNPQELADRLSREILPEVERLELQIRRELGQGGSQVRNSASEPVPTGYSEAVAEYFRKLSKGK